MTNFKFWAAVVIIAISFVAFFYNTIWFWFNNPELSQMEITILKWPWMIWLIIITVLIRLVLYLEDKE